MKIYFLIAVFFVILFAYIDKFLHGNISEKKSIFLHRILFFLCGASFLLLLVYETKISLFMIPGTLITFFGFHVIRSSSAVLGDNFIATKRFMIKGLYKKIRHPIYLGLIMCAFGFAIFSFSPLVLIYSFIMLISLIYVITDEEKELIKQYGKKYLDYRKKVPALIPKG